jgi:aminopeptidase N
MYRSQTFFGKFQAYLRHVYSSQMAKLGWDESPNESPRTGTLRGSIINMMIAAGDTSVCQEGFSRFSQLDTTEVTGDLRSCMFRAALRHDEATVFAALQQMYEKSSFPEEQRTCLSVMGSVRDPVRHTEMLDYVLFSGKVLPQDIVFPLSSLCGTTDEGGQACWNYLVANYDKLQDRFMTGPMWAPVVGLCCRGLRNLQDAKVAEQFFNHRSPGSAKRILSQALEAVQLCVTRLERDRDTVQAFLDETY